MRCASCGHDREAHQHWRPGGECGICMCPAFAAPLWKLLVDALRRRFRRA